MSTGKKIIYWDTCIFLAWLQDERREIGVMEGIEESVRKIHSNELTLLTSQMTNIEVLESRLNLESKKKWKDVFNRRNCQMVDVNPKVGEKAQFIRDYYDQQNIKLSTPDSIHLATAIIYKAEEFHTLDGSGKKRNGDLIPLNGNVAGHKLKICVPYAEQGSLLTGIPPLGS
jgi:predicted nucleic acid-binding protein